jgi:hypothetical protein
MARSAVERQFEIIGEALSQLAKADATIASRVPDHRRIVAFRNVLIHGYAALDHTLVWRVVQEHLTPASHCRRPAFGAGSVVDLTTDEKTAPKGGSKFARRPARAGV